MGLRFIIRMVTDYEKRLMKVLGTGSIFGAPSSKKKKRVRLKPKERIYIWEHPKLYGRMCHICGQRITKLSDLELDHKRPYSKGGTKLNLAHKDCNRMRGSRGLKYVQKRMALKPAKKKKAKKKVRKKRPRQTSSIFEGSLGLADRDIF